MGCVRGCYFSRCCYLAEVGFMGKKIEPLVMSTALAFGTDGSYEC